MTGKGSTAATVRKLLVASSATISTPYTASPSALTPAPQPPRVCPRCGGSVKAGKSHCAPCAIAIQRQHFLKIAEQGRIASHTTKAELKRGATQRKRHEAQSKWHIWSHPAWLTEQFYAEQIQPQLSKLEVKRIAAALDVSFTYASYIRAGRSRPHPRHWETLARLIGILRS